MLTLAAFRVDCTPPVGFPIGFGPTDSATGVRDPLFLRGFIFESDGQRCVVASLDYGVLMNRAYDALCQALAEAVGTTPDRAVVHCIHQHDTPMLDLELDPILGVTTQPEDWWTRTVQNCAEAARQAVANRQPVAAVGRGEVRLHGYASNRRVMGADGNVKGVRYSRCADPALRDEPVGIIDPMLRTVAFQGEDGNLLGSMSFYATHPQVSNGRHLYSADAPGEAMRLVTEQYDAGLHAFFTGAGGNVTAGKYTSTEDLEGNLLAFGRRLADGVAHNLQSLRWEAVEGLEWRTATFPFPAKAVSRAQAEAVVKESGSASVQSLIAATVLTSFEYPKNAEYELKLLKLGNARVLLCPGELFVEYQLFAQSVIADEFVALAANCSDNFLYLPLADHLQQGGYEATSFCWCTGEFEERFKAAVAALLA